MKNYEYVTELIDKIGEKGSEAIMDMAILRNINVLLEDIGDKELKKEIEEAFFKIGESYGNKEIDALEKEGEHNE